MAQNKLEITENPVSQQLDAAVLLKQVSLGRLHEIVELLRPDVLALIEKANEAVLKGSQTEELAVVLDPLHDEAHKLHSPFTRVLAEVSRHVKQTLGPFVFIDELDFPEGFKLRPKQQTFLKKLQEYFADGTRRTGFVKYPTGMGKTILIGTILRSLFSAEQKPKVLVLSSRKVINQQNRDKIRSLQDPKTRVSQLKRDKSHLDADVHIATYHFAARSMSDEKLSLKLADEYDVILLDECHRSFGKGMLSFLRKKHPESVVIGFSATPYIGPGSNPRKLKSALHYFEGAIDAITLKDACEDGDLPPIRVFRIKVRSEEYDKNEKTDEELQRRMNFKARSRIARQISIEMIPKGERGIVFCSGVKHSQDTALAIGDNAICVHGKMKKTELNDIFKRFRNGEIQFLICADLLTEGFDDDEVKHIIMLRPTMSMWLYEQMLGRGCRLDPNDPHKILTIWDVLGQHSQQCTVHGLHQMYHDHVDEFQNGRILFGPEEMISGDSLERESQQWSEGEYGDAVMEDTVLIEEVGKIITPMDEVYFADVEQLRKDLEGYVDAMELESINDLTTGEKQVDFSCQNGESVKWGAFLYRAGTAFEMSKHTEVLNELKKRVGIEVVESSRMDKEYFADMDKLRKDLKGYVDKMELESINDLTTGKNQVDFSCQNGESVQWGTFLNRAAKVFGMRKYTEVLNELKKRVGIEVVESMDKEYFADVDKLRKDLKGYVDKMELGCINDLTTGKYQVDFSCQNGETVQWGTFLDRAGTAFKTSKHKKALNKLKKRVGIEVVEKIEYPPMDKEYFSDVDKLRKDLKGYVDKME
ncbi:MAG: DEAD/DEAH box helicase family protein, partial [Candidatus Gracilibacteria bacterium]|nr:DEAD/DEAH box helicase family protein [Candidatus Gracilibacteria bacterium]